MSWPRMPHLAALGLRAWPRRRRAGGGPSSGEGQEHGGSARQRLAHVGRVLSLSSPTGLADGLALKEQRYAGDHRRFAPGHRSGHWVPRSPPDARARTRLGSTSSRKLAHEDADRCGARTVVGMIWRVGAQSQQQRASTIASATSARGRSDVSSTNSFGACAPPPRGPSPSTVSGIDAAKWLASLAPPRSMPGDRAAEPLARRGEQPAARLARVHPRPQPQERRLERHARRPRRGRRRARRRTPRRGRRAGRRTARRRPGRR